MISFGKGYYISTDKYNFIILKESKGENGEKIYEEISYHGTLDNLLKHLGNKFVRGVENPEQLKELKEVLVEFNELCKKKGKLSIKTLQDEYDKNRDLAVKKMNNARESKKNK